jgi:radical SAM superfamily enzyme YgiQ (UPF0313 family)
MMIGFPEETHAQIWQTTWFLIKASWAGAHDALPSIFSPYPGSELFESIKAEEKINEYDDAYWRKIIYAEPISGGHRLHQICFKEDFLAHSCAYSGCCFLYQQFPV